jgi:hypothetical protein
MPLLTPSRLAILIVSFAFISFFWTFGLPSQLGQPALPIVDHYDHKNVHTDPIVPAPIIETAHATGPKPSAHGARPTGEDEHRWDDATEKMEAPKPTGTGIAEFEKDGGRWEDEDKLKLGDTAAVKATKVTADPTTLLTELLPVPTGGNATNFTAADEFHPGSSTHEVETSCRDVRGAPHVMVVYRTSKAELDNKLPTHLQGLLSCVPNFAIFSDHSGEIDGFTVHNALDSIGSEAKRTHDEFREYQIMHADSEHKPDPKKTKDLDKWKWLPMVYKAYHLNPAAKWVVFIEADTSLSWTNLLQWVDRLDYRIPYHSGAPAFMNGIQIGQRGSGILLSQGALRRYVKSYDELYTSTWEERVGKECCGDLLLSMAMNDAHVEFYSSWPLLQGEQPSTLDYTKKHWCVPAVSWHHMNGDYLLGMWESERNWTRTHGWKKPYLFRDAFQEHVEPHIEAKKDGWDNLSQETKIVAPQGRQQQMKEEEERSRKHQEEEEQQKKDAEQKKQDDENDKLAAEKQKAEASLKESLNLQQADSEASAKKRKRGNKKEAPDWDKLAETYKDAGDSFERCLKACEQIPDCLQWRYTTKGDGECHLGKVLRLGKKMDGGDKWTSGWLVDRAKEVAKEWECKEPNWKFYQ